MKKTVLLLVLSLLVADSATAQLVVVFDKDVPASERKAFIDSANKAAAITRAERSGEYRRVPTTNRNGGYIASKKAIAEKDHSRESFGEAIVRRNNENAAIDKKLADSGDWGALEARRQTREMRRINNNLGQMQNAQRDMQDTQRQIQNRQRGIGGY